VVFPSEAKGMKKKEGEKNKKGKIDDGQGAGWLRKNLSTKLKNI